MSNKIKSYARKLTMVTLATIMFAANPVLAQGEDGNFICSGSAFEGLLSTIVRMAVFAGGAIAIVGGSAYTVAAAARPGGENEYEKKRNRAILLGGSVLFIIYGVDALLGQLDDTLSYDCILPFVESSDN